MQSLAVNIVFLILAALGLAFMVFALWGFIQASRRP
jgi:hypothetical protein